MKAPILLLIFNRPATTAKVVEAVRIARPARLYVAADGPREGVDGEGALCTQARKAATAVDWPCEVHTLFRERNLGCRNAVNSALDWFFGDEEEGIILEDDCVAGSSFFPFAQEMLDRYRADDRICMICGTNYLRNMLNVAETYVFSRYYSVWGWASWRRVWAAHDQSMRGWDAFRDGRRLRDMYRQRFMRRHMRESFDLVRAGAIDTWDIQFSFSCLQRNSLAVVPRVNMISNIGHSGTHTSEDSRNHLLPVFKLDTAHLVHPSSVAPDPRYDDVFFRREFGPDPGRTMKRWQRALIRRWHRVVD